MKWYSYLNSAVRLLDRYDGRLPFYHFSKNYFKEHRKYGSKDRKWIVQLCYSAFRTGRSLMDIDIKDRIIAGFFLTHNEPNPFLELLMPQWNEWLKEHPGSIVDDRIGELCLQYPSFRTERIFPCNTHLGSISDPAAFYKGHLVQPDLFLRIRPGAEEKTTYLLSAANIPFKIIAPQTLALPNGASVEEVVRINKDVVIQDASSQRVGELLKHIPLPKKKLKVWDCCAASGGKSILIQDILGAVELTVSDIRESILRNLKLRLQEANVNVFRHFSADLSDPDSFLPLAVNDFDLIVADVPCSGSGTWSRTPEQLSSFTESQIYKYAALQQAIVQRIMPYLKPGGSLLYSTCSVFCEENEDQIKRLTEAGWEIMESRYLEGYTHRADTLFACLLRKPL